MRAARTAGDTDPGPRAWMLGTLDELLTLSTDHLADRIRENLSAARTRLAEDRFNLVVIGEFKRGKSTLINSLLKRSILPTGAVPLTSVVTTIASGHHDRMIVHFNDGHVQERPTDELADYVTEARNPNNRRGIELVRVEIDHELLRTCLELVDTPGTGSIHDHNTAVARAFIPRIDAALCVLDAGQPLSQADRELVIDTAQRVPALLVVLNKIDHLEPADRTEALAFVRRALRDLLPDAPPELYAVSARTREGLRPLLRRLHRLAGDERQTLLLRSVAGLAHAAAADIGRAARFEAHAIELPLHELVTRADQFQQRIADLHAAHDEATDLMQHALRRALDEHVNQPLQDHARREHPRLHAALRALLQQLGPGTPRELATELQTWVDTTVQTEFTTLAAQLETTIAGQLTALQQHHVLRLRRILERVQATAQDLFGAGTGELLPETGLHSPSRFSFKRDDVENIADMLSAVGRTIAPGTLGRRLVIGNAEQRLVEMTDRHAGRLRSELAQRVTHTMQDYQHELATSVQAAIEAIHPQSNARPTTAGTANITPVHASMTWRRSTAAASGSPPTSRAG